MKFRMLSVFAVVNFFVAACFGQADLFFSPQGLNSGAVNSDLNVTLEVGDEVSVFAYFTTHGPSMTEIDQGGFFEIDTDVSGVVDFTGGETFQFDISIQEVAISQRWQVVGPGVLSNEGQTLELSVFNVNAGEGMLNQNTGPVFFDQGYDADADAFLFGRADIRAVGPGTVKLNTSVRAGGLVNQGQAVDPVFGAVTITVGTGDLLLGDLNGDGVVTLLDVGLFIDLLVSSQYEKAADMNCDGVVSLLDVQLLIDAINFP